MISLAATPLVALLSFFHAPVLADISAGVTLPWQVLIAGVGVTGGLIRFAMSAAELKTEFRAVKEAIGLMNARVESMEKSIHSLERSIDAVSRESSSNTKDIADIRQELTKVTNDVSEMRKWMQRHETAVAAA